MELTEEIMDQMDRYLEGAMSEQEMHAFESELESNLELKAAFEEHKSLIHTVEAAAVADELSAIIERHKSSKKSRIVGMNRTWIAVAASVVILVGSFFFIRNLSGGSAGSLYVEYYQRDPGLPTTMSTADDPGFTEAMVLYKEGDYRAALEAFDRLMNENPTSDTLLFYRGLCHMELNQPKVSTFIFNQIDSSSELFGEKAQWYRALAFLQAEDLPASIEILQDIAQDPAHRFREQAGALLESL